MAAISFYKFHGTGNDFILIDDRDRSFPTNNNLIREMCDRHFGIGADGLILLQQSKNRDFGMTYFNSDGNESTMCGNGGRCIIALADFLSLCGSRVMFTAADGEHEGVITARSGNTWQVRLKMKDVSGYTRDGQDVLIDTGSPHLVHFSEEVESLHVVEKGRTIRYSDRFSRQGINVDFVKIKQDGLFVRTYERGVEDETLSCGTGATASCLAHALTSGLPSGSIDVHMPGGHLSVRFRKEGDTFKDIWLEGPAQMVFNGTYIY